MFKYCIYKKLTANSIRHSVMKINEKQRNFHNQPIQFPTQSLDHLHKHIKNFSSKALSSMEKDILCSGLDFCIPQRKVNPITVEAEFEGIFQSINNRFDLSNNEETASAKAKLVSLACHVNKKVLPSLHFENKLNKNHFNYLKKLSGDEDLIITKPDKGRGVVLLDKKDYISKMELILSDSLKFKMDKKQINRSHLLEQKVDKQLKLLFNNNSISQFVYEQLKPVGTNIPRLYGLPKIHKDNIPLRPILSMVKSPTHALAKFLVGKIKPVEAIICNHNAGDSFQFAKNMREMNIKGRKRASLDVVSLFTNVPIVETIKIILDTIRI